MPAGDVPAESAAPAGGARTYFAAPSSPLLDGVWYRCSVRAQLLIAFIAIGVAATLVAGMVTILQARKSTRLEIAASLRMAEILVGETAELLQAKVPAEQFLRNLPSQLRSVRHVRVSVRDASGLVLTRDAAARKGERAPAPAWFAALIAPRTVTHEMPVIVQGQRIGTVLLAGEPSDEIAEVWENTVDFALVCLLVGLAAIAALNLLLRRLLDPLTGLTAGLLHLERRNYQVRLARPKVRELAAITDRFNALAQGLDALRAENVRLSSRLVTAQDDERRRTALDLHDEVGPSLFGLKANAASIANAAGPVSDALLQSLRERASEMLAIVERLQAVNRSILNRLRPMALGHVPLADLASELVRERARQHPEISFRFSTGRLSSGYGDTVELTIYRCLQEGLTNAVRHARAQTVEIRLAEAMPERNGGACLELVLSDDGCGIAPAARFGRGLLGMQERVQALAGSCALERGSGRGSILRVGIPLPPRQHGGIETPGSAA